MKTPTIEEVRQDPCFSFWLKEAVQSAITRDCLDAYRDAQILAEMLRLRCNDLLK